MTRPNFEIALAKGELGEVIVRRHLEKRGWIVYKPYTDGAHAFDILAIFQKRNAIAMDVKAKSRMNKFPATGINQKHFKEYQFFSEKYRMPFWLVFVDESQQTIYGNSLTELELHRLVSGVQYPFLMKSSSGEIRLWPLEAMKHIANLDADSANGLTNLSQRNYGFEVAA